jgi:hypothetical protein
LTHNHHGAGVNGGPDITKEITKGSEIKCQCCVGLKSELNNIATELKTAMEIIEILKRRSGHCGYGVIDNTNPALSNENESYIPPSERNRIQIQTNGYKVVIDKLNDHREIYLSRSNRSPLTHRCNKPVSLGIFPGRLKYSEKKPLFKKCDTSNISNYRPISLSTSFFKVLEKAMNIQLLEHLNKTSS